MNKLLIAFVLCASLAAFGQGRGGHTPAGGPPAGAGSGMGSGMGAGMGHGPSDVGRPEPGTHGPSADHQNNQNQQTQQSLKDSQINSGSFQMLEKKTGMTADQALYASSGAKNYGQFVSAVVVSKNLGLDTQQVLDGLKDKSLGSTLQDLGVSKSKADDAVKQAKQEIKQANKKH